MEGSAREVHCPECGDRIPAGSGFCRACGHDLTGRTVAAGDEAADAALAAATCPRCGASLRPEAQFCGGCGEAAPAAAEAASEPPMAAPVPSLAAASADPAARELRPPAARGRRVDRRAAAVVAAVALLAGAGLAAVMALGGGSDSRPAAKRATVPSAAVQTSTIAALAAASAGSPSDSTDAAATTTDAPSVAETTTATTAAPTTTGATGAVALRGQVQRLDGLMRLSAAGRAAAIRGDTVAAIANRTDLLRRLSGLRADVSDARLRGGLDAFRAGIRESLRQNRVCATRCPAADLARVARLKRTALARLNPLLRRYAGTEYRLEQI